MGAKGSKENDARPIDVVERRKQVLDFLEREVWPSIPAEHLGRMPSRSEEDEILGYGEEPKTP